MRTLIPMAGAGSRFTEAGYTIPKPLLPILGEPMVINATKALPESDNYTFIVRDFQISEYQIDQHLKKYYPNADVIVLDHLTEGQAVTCLKAKEVFRADEELLIGASDNGMIYDLKAFEKVKQDADALVFTFRNNPAVDAKPQAYGWVKLKGNSEVVERMSVKVPISSTPQNDHAVVGAFWFKKADYFVKAAEHMIANNRRINNEFYVDECINDLIELGYKVKVFEIDHYVCWGTPVDYQTFNYWSNYYDLISKKL
ncbi:sugar phosphate nucleotidyltransferase [Aurantibacillus circumpalustris]|uniref:sugar phosphate nucleotidyltransferase n=1 Tax=Aurantibacillus circumpalustris TaxID=3036359 RepID=UPI00295B46B6|nr:sugar phosphate nucleotidyltransferase [Aurantibacillus circumpalustris]